MKISRSRFAYGQQIVNVVVGVTVPEVTEHELMEHVAPEPKKVAGALIDLIEGSVPGVPQNPPPELLLEQGKAARTLMSRPRPLKFAQEPPLSG